MVCVMHITVIIVLHRDAQETTQFFLAITVTLKDFTIVSLPPVTISSRSLMYQHKRCIAISGGDSAATCNAPFASEIYKRILY